MPFRYARLGQIEVKTVLPEEAGEGTTVIDLSIAGQIRQFVSKPIAPENIATAKKVVGMFYRSGDSLKKWRESALALRDIAYVQWPSFVETIDFSSMMLEDQARFKESENRILTFAEEVMNQYGIAQQDWDKLLSHVDSIRQELGMQELGYLGDPVILVIVLIAIAIVASASVGIAAFSYKSEGEISSRVMAPAKALEKITAAKGELAVEAQKEIVSQQKQLREDLIKITDVKTKELLTEGYKTSVNGMIDTIKTMDGLEKTLPAIAESQAKAEAEIAKEKEAGKPLAWLKYIPFALLGVVGIMLVPSIKEMLPKRK